MRRSSRVRWRMPLHITSLDPNIAFSALCETLVVNFHGAGVRSPAALPIATHIKLESADHRTATGWITDFEPLGHDAKWWLIGIALERPENFWGIPNPPDNWMGQLTGPPPPTAHSPERKFSVWPGAYGPQSTASTPVITLVSSKTHSTEKPSPAAARELIDPAELLSRVQTELEQRAEKQWHRLRSEFEPQLLASAHGLQQELQDSLVAWRAERSQVESKVQELLAIRDDVSARLSSITRLLREQSAPLREEIISDAREQVDKLIRDFQGHLRRDREEVEAAQHSFSAALEQQISAKTDAAQQELRKHSAEQVAGLASKMMYSLEQQLQAKLAKQGETLHQMVLQELQQRQQAASQAFAGHMEELRASEGALRERARQLTEELSMHSESALAQLRVQVQELGEKHDTELAARLKQHDATAETVLRTASAELLAGVRETLQSDVHHQQRELTVSHQSWCSDMKEWQIQARKIEAQLADIREAHELVESLSRSLPETVERRVREAAAAALEQMSGPAQEQITKQAQEQLAALRLQARKVADLQSMLAQREQRLQELLVQGRKDADALLRQSAEQAAADFQKQLRFQFEEGRKQFDEAQSSALSQLETLQEHAEHLTSIVDVEMQKSADALLDETVADAVQRMQAASESVRETHREKAQADATILQGKLQQDADALVAKAVASAEEQLRAETEAMHRDHVARVQAEIDRLLGAVAKEASDAGSELRKIVEGLQQELARTKLDSAEIQGRVEQAQASLAYKTEQFQATLHDTFLEATGEIRGRIHQAVEMAEEPIDRHGREIQMQLTAAVRHMTDELRKQFEEARDGLQVAAAMSGTKAEQALQEYLGQAMKSFRSDADNLARRSMERWQAAVSETLSEIPQLLGNKLRVDQH